MTFQGLRAMILKQATDKRWTQELDPRHLYITYAHRVFFPTFFWNICRLQIKILHPDIICPNDQMTKISGCLTCYPRTPWLAAERCQHPGLRCWHFPHLRFLSPEPRCRPSASHSLLCEAGSFRGKVWEALKKKKSVPMCNAWMIACACTWQQRLCWDRPWHCWASPAGLSGCRSPPHTAKARRR